MKKSLFLFCAAAVFLIQNVSGQQLGALYTEKSGGFAMSMPAGWQTFDFNQKYLMITGPEDSGFTPNIGFGDEDYEGTLPEYIDAAMGILPLFFTDIAVIGRSAFKTNAGTNGECVTYQCTMGTVRVRQKLYVMPNLNGTAVMVVTCTAPLVAGEKYDAVFDASVKTFNWTR